MGTEPKTHVRVPHDHPRSLRRHYLAAAMQQIQYEKYSSFLSASKLNTLLDNSFEEYERNNGGFRQQTLMRALEIAIDDLA